MISPFSSRIKEHFAFLGRLRRWPLLSAGGIALAAVSSVIIIPLLRAAGIIDVVCVIAVIATLSIRGGGATLIVALAMSVLHLIAEEGIPVGVSVSTSQSAADLIVIWLVAAVCIVIKRQAEDLRRKQAEESLRDSQHFLNNIINSIGDPIFVKDRQHRFVLINDAFCRLTGLTQESALGKSDLDFFPEDQVQVFWDRDEAVFDNGLSDINEELITDAAGSVRTIHTHKRLYVDPHEHKFIVGLIRDVTESKRADDALRESEQKYRSIVDNLGLGIAILNQDLHIVTANARMVEWSQARTTATTVNCDGKQSDCSGQCGDDRCVVRRTFEDGQVHEAVLEYEDRGENRYHRIVTSPIVGRDERTYTVIEMVEDVTTRIRAEQETQRYMSDLEQIWQEQARLSTELAGSLEELEAAKRETDAALERVHAMQASLIHSEKMASIGVLAAGVAHEINNPVGFVTSNLRELLQYSVKIQKYLAHVRLLEQTVASGEMEQATVVRAELDVLRRNLKLDFVLNDLQDLVKESLDGTSSIESIVKALKLYSRSDDGTTGPVDLREAAENSLRVVANQIKYKADVLQEFENVPPVAGSIGPLQQVFSNLLVNAAQAIADHGTIRLGIRAVGDRVVATVADTGSGIKPDHIKRIFEPFFTTKDVGQGTGLGLSIVYDIVHEHGGEIEVQSVCGEGTTFTMSFPAMASAASVGGLKE